MRYKLAVSATRRQLRLRVSIERPIIANTTDPATTEKGVGSYRSMLQIKSFIAFLGEGGNFKVTLKCAAAGKLSELLGACGCGANGCIDPDGWLWSFRFLIEVWMSNLRTNCYRFAMNRRIR